MTVSMEAVPDKMEEVMESTSESTTKNDAEDQEHDVFHVVDDNDQMIRERKDSFNQYRELSKLRL